MLLSNNYPLNRKVYAAIFWVVFLIGLLFAVYTQHAWEDYYITYRISKNLATGHGLLYSLDAKSQSFTSPLGVLLPAFLSFITFNFSDELVLWLFRIIGCCLCGVSAVLLIRIAKQIGFKLLSMIFLLSMFRIDLKTMDFSINGMETAFMAFFFTLGIYFLIVPCRHLTLKLGLTWGGLMWTRPDSFVYIFSIVCGCLLFNPKLPSLKNRLEALKVFIQAAAIASILYIPWVVIAWLYYGSPIPYTIIAKSLCRPILGNPVWKFLFFPLKSFLDATSIEATFMPAYYQFGNWSIAPIIFGRPLAYLCAFCWCLPFVSRRLRAFSFALCLMQFYLSYIVVIVYPWYFAPVTILSILVFSQIIEHIATVLSQLQGKVDTELFKEIKFFVYLSIGSVLVMNVLFTIAGAYELRAQQKIIEEGNRKKIGLWLKQNASSAQDTVFLEPLGYIGFYSQLKMLDAKGLVSPEVVALKEKLGRRCGFAKLILALKPDWIVLRPQEIETIQEEMPFLLNDLYKKAKVFDVSERINYYRILPGRPYLQFDQNFTVFRKK